MKTAKNRKIFKAEKNRQNLFLFGGAPPRFVKPEKKEKNDKLYKKIRLLIYYEKVNGKCVVVTPSTEKKMKILKSKSIFFLCFFSSVKTLRKNFWKKLRKFLKKRKNKRRYRSPKNFPVLVWLFSLWLGTWSRNQKQINQAN